MKWVEDARTVTVPAAGSVDVVMRPIESPIVDLSIWGTPKTPRAPGDTALPRAFTSSVYFGPTSQGAATVRSNDEAYQIFDSGASQRIIPANNPTASLHSKSGDRVLGFPITVRITNTSVDTSEQPTNITGVTITSVDQATATGTGTLTFTAAGTLLEWQAPGAGAPGAAQNVGGGGSFTLAGGDGTDITVSVTAIALPAGDETDNIDIVSIPLVIDVDFVGYTIQNG